jgi:hypothetical protein
MAERKFGERSPGAADLAGDLENALYRHARERANHFFFYLYLMKVLVNRLNALDPDLKVGPTDGVEVAATDQIDTGFRRGARPEYQRFDSKDANVVTLNSTSFGSSDAAHYCNLGVSRSFLGRIAQSKKKAGEDLIVRRCVETLERVCGDTEQLPQRINIGPDKVIDRLHGDLALMMLGVPAPRVISTANVHTYRNKASERMQEYRDAKSADGDHGIAACADCYLEAYNDVGVPTAAQRRAMHIDYRKAVASTPPGAPLPEVPTVPRQPFVESVYRAIESEVRGSCANSDGQLNASDYLS